MNATLLWALALALPLAACGTVRTTYSGQVSGMRDQAPPCHMVMAVEPYHDTALKTRLGEQRFNVMVVLANGDGKLVRYLDVNPRLLLFSLDGNAIGYCPTGIPLPK